MTQTVLRPHATPTIGRSGPEGVRRTRTAIERLPTLVTPGNRRRAFISYSRADRAWADWLHKALETYRVLSRPVGAETAAGVGTNMYVSDAAAEEP